MPLPAMNKLSPDSSDEAVRAAVSECVATEVRGGTPQDQAVAMCYSMAREATGKELGRPEGA